MGPRLKFLVSSLLIGALSVGLAWAGAGLVPVGGLRAKTTSNEDGDWLEATEEAAADSTTATEGALEPLQDNQVYAGAHAVSIAPDCVTPPDGSTALICEKYSGTWETDVTKCETFGELGRPQDHPGRISKTDPSQVTDFRVRWHENTNCIYTGGFDIGPAHAVNRFDDEYGLYARATAISDGQDTVVLMILDGAYYFAKYANMCNNDPKHKSQFDDDGPGANTYTQDCGFRDLQNSLAAKYGYTSATSRGQYGIESASFFLASSHAHASPDFVGAWGGVPRWYMQQVEDAIRAAVYGAIDNMQPAFVEASEILYRGGNGNRRDHYQAAEEAGVSWMRFVAETEAPIVCVTPQPSPTPTDRVPPGQAKKETPAPAPSPSCTQPPPEKRAIATVGTYSAHPVDRNNDVAFGDLAAVFAKRAEDRFGGVGLFFQTGFGNISSGDRRELGRNLVSLLPELGTGPQVTGNLDVRTAIRTFDHPVTNSALGGGGIAGIFDRPFEPRPSAVSIGKDSLAPGPTRPLGPDSFGDPGLRSPHKRCNSASSVTVNSSVSLARIGPVNGGLLITGGPGELFSNYTNTVKEKNAGGITFPLSLVNDGLGYIMQSFETDHVARQAVGFANGPLSEYEDAYSIDACFGDHALEQTLAGMKALS